MRVAFPTGADNASLLAWARQVVDDLGRVPAVSELPIAADDAAAAIARVGINEGYRTPDGLVRWRRA